MQTLVMPRRSQSAFFAKLFAVALFGLVTGTTLGAGNSFTDYARVLDVEPIKETVTVPVRRRRCEYSSRAQSADVGFAGDVRSKYPSVSIGAAIGEEMRHRESALAMRSCRLVTVHEPSERIVAYRVRYAYGDSVFTRLMPEYPQERLPVRVKLHPYD